MSAFTLTVTEGIAHLVFDLPGEKVNKFTAAVLDELSGVIAELGKRTDLRAVVIASGKPDMFIAGADIAEIQGLTSIELALAKARRGQDVFNQLAALRVPTIAVIDGPCLGGGMELALACTYRVVTDAEKTRLGLPEVTLGIIPGWGGTQRLPRLVGLANALDLILSGRHVPGPKAFKIGLADACVARAFLAEELPRFISKMTATSGVKRAALPRQVRMLQAPLIRSFVLRAARKEVLRKTHGLMPAPLGAVQVLGRTCGTSLSRGLEIEAEVFSTLAVTPECHHLVDAFFANEDLKKSGGPKSPDQKVVKAAGVLGAGVMGGGIAWAFSAAGLPVRMKDLKWDAVAKGLHQAATYDQALLGLRKLTPGQHAMRMLRIAGTVDFTGFQQLDLVVEAVVEDLAIKRKVLAECEAHVRADCVLATNTSSLSVADMAIGLIHPERFVGMHFFNPVNRMPLVEVIAGPASSAEAVQLTAATVRAMGKTAIIVRDCPGFLVNRILLPYLNEAARTVEDGAYVEQVDRIFLTFGMPMGPFTLTDEVGIDVGYKVANILHQAYGERHAVADLLKVMYTDLHLTGTKGGRGFYVHDGRQLQLNPDLDPTLKKIRVSRNRPAQALSDSEIRERCLLIMINESARCIEEGIVAKATHLDLAMLLGTGFPPSRGGPLHYADSLGVQVVVDRLKHYEAIHGPRFAPTQLLIDHARDGRALC